jgi:hypothetical protein
MKSNHSWIRRSQRVLRMVSELHRMGYQRLRVMPYEYPLAWRLTVAPISVFSKHNGAFIPDEMRRARRAELERELASFDGFFPTYSSKSENEYFEWKDARNDDARALAEKFILRFPGVSKDGKGRDWIYAGWLAELLGYLESGDILPVMFSEFFVDSPHEMRGLPFLHLADDSIALSDFPLPPPGEVDDRQIPP